MAQMPTDCTETPLDSFCELLPHMLEWIFNYAAAQAIDTVKPGHKFW